MFSRLFKVNQKPIIINTIPGEALINLDVNPDASTIHSIEPVNPSIVRIIPAIIHPIPPIRLIRTMINS